ncbi:MAG: hypothetical protein HFF61_05795 [Oscillospiraceae bacterium]|jgi:hypothetical protein|nr:hypothetical protein [Oscillospiraceae bacterium]
MNRFHLPFRAVALFLMLCLMGGIATGCAMGSMAADASSSLVEGLFASSQKAATPEEAIEQFFAALKMQNIEAMMACCDIEDYCDRFSFADYTERMNSSFIITGGAPTEYPLYRDLMVFERQRDFAFRIRALAYSLLLTEEEWLGYLNNQTVAPADHIWALEFTKAVDPAQLQNLDVLRIDKNCSDLQDDERVQENFCKAYSAENNVSMSVLLQINGDLFCKSFVLSEIGGSWLITNFCSPLMVNENGNGAAVAVGSEADYKTMIAG